MRERKQSDSPSGYDREIRPRLLDFFGDHERQIRLRAEARWRRRMEAAMPTTGVRYSDDFEGAVE